MFGVQSEPSQVLVRRVAIINPAGQLVEIVDAGGGDPSVVERALNEVAFGRRRDPALELIAWSLLWLVVMIVAAFALVEFMGKTSAAPPKMSHRD